LKELDRFAARRVRIGGARNERLTGNFVAAQLAHDTFRALDPHLHTHCIVFNATFDAVENRWEPLENYELPRRQFLATRRDREETLGVVVPWQTAKLRLPAKLPAVAY
jgi:conjugative relaxase-like TrwC/TraI family protein